MKLLIDPTGGMAGDMFAAGLASAGADFPTMKQAMMAAAKKLGSAEIKLKKTKDGSSQLAIFLDSERLHLAGSEAQHILQHLFEQFHIKEKYRTFGFNALDILIKAEKQAHIEFNIFIASDHPHAHHHVHHSHIHDHDEDEHTHQHSHVHVHDHLHGHAHDHLHTHHEKHEHAHTHTHDHHLIKDDELHHHLHDLHHSHPHSDNNDAFLHEAQDIVIDIMGAVMGMQLLNIEPVAQLTGPISVGGGHVICSHGKLSIPAPATTVILRTYHLPWKKGPLERELLTPTGAAILAALDAKLVQTEAFTPEKKVMTGYARGTKVLAIPPLELQLFPS